MANKCLYKVYAIKNVDKKKYFEYNLGDKEQLKLRRFAGVLFVVDPAREDEYTEEQYEKLNVPEDEFVVVSYDQELTESVINEGGEERLEDYMKKNYP